FRRNEITAGSTLGLLPPTACGGGDDVALAVYQREAVLLAGRSCRPSLEPRHDCLRLRRSVRRFRLRDVVVPPVGGLVGDAGDAELPHPRAMRVAPVRWLRPRNFGE